MTTVLFFAMVVALATGLTLFFLAGLAGFGDRWRRLGFFAGCLTGFWGCSVVMLAGDIAQAFSDVQAGMEEAVDNAFHAGQSSLLAPAVAAWSPGRGDRLCSPTEASRSLAPTDCLLAMGVNSTTVCREWVLYVPFLLPHLKPCAALRTSSALLENSQSRQMLAEALRHPCAYLSQGADLQSRRLRKALHCETGGWDREITLIVDQPDGSRVLHLKPGQSLPR